MKPEFIDYLSKIGITDLFLERTEKVVAFYERIYGSELQDIFVSEYLDSEGKRQFENFWLFTSNMACEAKLFLQQENFDAVPLTKKIRRWELSRTEYDFDNFSDKSRMLIMLDIGTQIRGELKASRENCHALRDIFLKYIVPNLAN